MCVYIYLARLDIYNIYIYVCICMKVHCACFQIHIYIWHVYEHINVYGFVIYICVCVHNIYICIDRPISPHIDKCTYA